MIIKTIDDLKNAYPDLVNQIISEALAEERNYQLDMKNKMSQSIHAEQNAIENIAAAAKRR